MFDLVLTEAGWRLNAAGEKYAPDLDIRENIHRDGNLVFVTVSAVLQWETVSGTICLNNLLWPVEDRDYMGPANEHLRRMRATVVRKARAIREISGEFLRGMARLEAELRPRAVAA